MHNWCHFHSCGIEVGLREITTLKILLNASKLICIEPSETCMSSIISVLAGNFRGVLIFVIFVVDLAIMRFSHLRKIIIYAYGDMVLCESMMMGVAINIVAAWPTLSKQK